MSSTRRVPLSSNPNAANSPLRAPPLYSLQANKKPRSHAELMREEAYGQPPPAKRQMVDLGIQRSTVSPSRARPARTIVHRAVSKASALGTAAAERAAQNAPACKPSEKELDNIRQWRTQIRARFPKMVFYFESISDEQRSKLAKQVTQLGAREEKFFSINITHVVTTRPIPPAKANRDENEPAADGHASVEQLKTIDPSLLNRTADLGIPSTSTTSVRRKLLFDTASNRRIPLQAQEDAIKRPKARNTDVLHRAREMDKRIWSLEKLQKILDMVQEPDPYKSAVLGQCRGTSQGGPNAKAAEQSNLLQLLQNERFHGPSDRDPTVASKDLHIFKGPYIYVYDVEEKLKPIMVREYAKVADKKYGEWPQFRVASQGRCPFVEDEPVDRENRVQTRTKERAAKAAVEVAAPSLKPPQVEPPKPVTGKRTLAEMEEAQHRVAPVAVMTAAEPFDHVKLSNAPSLDFRTQNAFRSHAKTGRFLAGEPVASGVQPSNVTSAIRSQMISSTTGVLGAKAGTSKEIHGLQRKVLQKASTPAVSQDLSSRRLAEMSHDSNTFIWSASLGRATHRKLDAVDEDESAQQKAKLRRTASVPVPQAKQKARDPKPGYCENCQDKFEDFDDHIVSRKHRKFADNNDNWAQLDALLSQLTRVPRYQHEEEDEW
ncbi:Dfp1/Him1, central region-domain-containing protein [Lasiosphaeria miniovina]|uniref:Dfp1/Him1, central region-domain-containing protein n=1 Tax=Lasiosphaeria miniovina TaxID=1954250 RepID=A0AA40DNG8_9PEZI|nr:Dfp1/Him1, central region-domain-containing protein [Lasiosphaeria miniovina]KAK0709670.1 Dfp1/Him1, central region-domain-containing protein [Lasiosphaeria miniovina]